MILIKRTSLYIVYNNKEYRGIQMFFFIHISVFFSRFLCWSAFYIICILKMSLFLKFPIVKINSKIKLLMQMVASQMNLGVLSAVIWCKLRSFFKKSKKKTPINHSFPSVALWCLSFFASFQTSSFEARMC